MNLTQQIDELLVARKPAAYCDQCIAELLATPDAAAVEVRTKALAATSYYERAHGKCTLCGSRRMICMPTGTRVLERPADLVDNAVNVMHLATGRRDDTSIDDGKDPSRKPPRAED